MTDRLPHFQHSLAVTPPDFLPRLENSASADTPRWLSSKPCLYPLGRYNNSTFKGGSVEKGDTPRSERRMSVVTRAHICGA